MANLPADILLLLFRSLSKGDQVECMTVCRQWHDIILQHSLYRVISILRQIQLNSLIEIVLEDPSLGEKVEKLKFDVQLDEDFDGTWFVTLFPNLREFTLITDEEKKIDFDAFKALDDHPWCERMEKMVEDSSDQMTKSLLFFGACNNLTSISVVGNTYESSVDLVNALGNAPGLKTLELSKYTIFVREVEKLHTELRLLNSVKLNDCYIDCRFFPPNIEPATSVKSFDCISSGDNSGNKNIQLMKYISKKYTELEELAFAVFYDPTIEEEAVEYRALLSAYFKRLGRQLKSLSLSLFCFDDREHSAGFDWDVLDEAGCQLIELKLSYLVHEALLQGLAMTNQAKYIKSLTVNKVMNAHNDFQDALEWEWLAHFKSLKDLTLYFPYKIRPFEKYRVDLAQVLKPIAELELETLELRDVEILFYPKDTSITYPSIKKISLDSGEFNLNSDAAISQYMPNLKHLVLNHSLKSRSVLMFPKTSFDSMEISRLRIREPTHVLVITLDDNQHRLYAINTNPFCSRSERQYFEENVVPLTNSQPFENSTVVPYLTVVCKSLSSFYADNIDE